MKKFLFLRFWKPVFSAAQRRLDARVRQSVDAWVMNKGYTKPLVSVEDIAGDIGVPADQLARDIHIAKRKPVLSWRKELRLEEARYLLVALPELPVSTIGEMVGIEDKSNFRKQFTQFTGVSPLEWRKRYGL